MGYTTSLGYTPTFNITKGGEEVTSAFTDRLLSIRQPNAGLPAARNTALRHATADLVALLDADDIWLPRRLELSVRAHDGAASSYGKPWRSSPWAWTAA